MKTETQSQQELVNLQFSNTIIIGNEALKTEAKKFTVELEAITKKKQVDYEKLKEVVMLKRELLSRFTFSGVLELR